MENSKVPPTVMDQSVEAKKKYFENKLISHPKLEEAFTQAKIAVLKYKTPLILLYGPSGVGKSTLLTKLYNHLVNELINELNTDFSRVPAVLFESKAAESIQFSWKDYFKAGLIELHEPCIDHKMIPQHLSNIVNSRGFHSRETSSAIRWAFESALVHRRPLACMVDEAQHIAKISKGNKLMDQMDVVKSIANQTKVPHVLAGTYELLKFRNKSAQLSNRSIDVHIPRYRAENQQDLKEFQTSVLTLQDHMPVQEIDLLEHWEFLYERSIGCIGALKLWLQRALDIYLMENETQFSLKYLEKTSLSIKQCSTMAREAREGELELHETEEEREFLLKSLGLNTLENNTQVKNEKKSSKKVGQRNPVRDSCGK
ncbi:ATP-binding protein [Paenibacillus marchantiae]|uniref:ATP-binding protein n=1 Tax=Paenibacillus marchantiae TaxID=3026433 RepID=UPI00237AA150|nr:ATP-binding protein [Paenibacillus marchantiae]WDQ32192.1 ATP-binding protein [Paenibacillus marchantiae]